MIPVNAFVMTNRLAASPLWAIEPQHALCLNPLAVCVSATAKATAAAVIFGFLVSWFLLRPRVVSFEAAAFPVLRRSGQASGARGETRRRAASYRRSLATT
jgi:hypothetical protein